MSQGLVFARAVRDRRSWLARMRIVLVAMLAGVVFIAMPAVAAGETPAPGDPTTTAAHAGGDEDAAAEESKRPSEGSMGETLAANEAGAFLAPGSDVAPGGVVAPFPLKADVSQAMQADEDDPREHYLPEIPPEAGPGVHYGFNPDPYLPHSIAELKQSPEPSCAAPALPDATEAGSGEGYTVPLRLKLSNGVVLAGYSSRANGWGQPVPFGIVSSRITGWVTARVSLPSLQVVVEPEDVLLCPFDRAAGTGPLIKAFMPYLLSEVETQIAQIKNGTPPPDYLRVVPFPGSSIAIFPGALGVRFGGLDNMGLKNLIARQVKVEVSRVAADGSLELATDLESTMDADPALVNGNPNIRFTCTNMRVSGTFGTAPKQLAATAAEPPAIRTETGGVWYPNVPRRQDQIVLPTKNLTGAIEGGTATVGSNSFPIQVPKSGGASCGGQVNFQFYGFGFRHGDDEPNWNPEPPIRVLPPNEGFPIVAGLNDLSLDVTVDRVELPKPTAGLLAGYGFEMSP